MTTPPKFNMESKKKSLEKEAPLGNHHSGSMLNFGGVLHGHFPLQRLRFFQIVTSLTLNKKKTSSLGKDIETWGKSHSKSSVLLGPVPCSPLFLRVKIRVFKLSLGFWWFIVEVFSFSFATTWSNHPQIKDKVSSKPLRSPESRDTLYRPAGSPGVEFPGKLKQKGLVDYLNQKWSLPQTNLSSCKLKKTWY